MSRRLLEFVALMTIVVVAHTSMIPAAARAQSQKRTPVIGLLLVTTAATPGSPKILGGFKQSLRESGWVEGETVRLELRWSEGLSERFAELAAELVRLKVDVMVTFGSQATRAAMEATAIIPIVFVAVADPVGAGFVPSLARPGANVTGVTNQFSDLDGKELQLARQLVPGLHHVGIMWTPVDPGSALGFKRAQQRYSSAGITVTSAPVAAPEDFEAAFKILSRSRPDFLMVHPTPVIQRNRQRVAEFALRERLPTSAGSRLMVDDGSVMMSYGPDLRELVWQAAVSVNKILRGARPGDLPVEQPTRFELVVNRRVARTIGVELSPAFLSRVDQLIE